MIPQMNMQNPRMAEMLKQQMINNPRQFAQNALRSGHFNNSPVHMNALEAIANNNQEELSKIAGNVCKEHNVSMEDAQRQYMQYYGINQSVPQRNF